MLLNHHHGLALLTKITFPAGTLMTDQTYAGSTSPVAVTAGEGLLEVRCCGCTVFPPLEKLIYTSKISDCLFIYLSVRLWMVNPQGLTG